MQLQVIAPSTPLSYYIQHYWVLETSIDEETVKERVVPTGNIELMFHYRKPFQTHTPQGNILAQPQSSLSGISRSWFDVSAGGGSGALAVTFYPGAAAYFFNFPMRDLEGQSIQLSDLTNNEAGFIEEQLAEADSLQQRIKIVENYLMRKLRPMVSPDLQTIGHGVQYIKKLNGQLSALDLAKELCVTPKTLERKFACYVGETPKQYIKIVRFQKVMQNLMFATPGKLTQQALENGYFDQAHFIKDFKAYSGYTPRELLLQNHCPK
jgi:AraC-like DNA-binding protein